MRDIDSIEAQEGQGFQFPGEFEITADVPADSADRRVELVFSKLQRLPAPETREVSALLKSVGFEEPGHADPNSK